MCQLAGAYIVADRLTPWAGEKGRPMGCLLALLAGFAPRVALALIWIFTNLVDRAFNGFLVPLFGRHHYLWQALVGGSGRARALPQRLQPG